MKLCWKIKERLLSLYFAYLVLCYKKIIQSAKNYLVNFRLGEEFASIYSN